ncbi:uncharacterized protein C2orf73 homolog [Anolis carolinensis]|uniref:uncharacterized protein C2orf73 homolog n=1 Tax=Anolis carolinensis TaxID=28377 RepID=UPI002F2B41B6
MHQMVTMRRRGKGLPPAVPDSFRVFNIELPQRNNILEKMPEMYTPGKPKPRYMLEWRHNPQPIHAKFIKTNTKFLNEPVLYMETEDTKRKQGHWWPTHGAFMQRPKAPYDPKSTQRSDFQKPPCKLVPAIKYTKRQPTHGIVPLTSPRPSPGSLPRLFQEQISFKHNYDSRATPNIPYQGKKCGTFVWTQMKPERVPEGTKAMSCAPRGAGFLEEPKTEKGSSVGNGVTSSCLCLPESQETAPDSDKHLSETDVGPGAKADPRTTEGGQESSEISQTNKMDVSGPGEKPPSPPKASSGRPHSLLPPLHPATQSPGEIQRA